MPAQTPRPDEGGRRQERSKDQQRRGGGSASEGGARGRSGKDGRGGERRTGPPGLDVPGAASEPLGREQAGRTRGAPPRRAARTEAPPRPPLPEDEEPDLPKPVQREIERVLGRGARARDIALALSLGSQAIDEDRPDVAVEVLAWARHEAPRLAVIREALGVAYYLREEYGPALSELQAYRRLSGRHDQNHLAGDCLRALGRDLDRVSEVVQPLIDDDTAPEDRRAEAVIVRAAALADAGELPAARAVVRRFLERPRDGDDEHDLRLRYQAADLAERAGDLAEAERQFTSIAAVASGFLDVDTRLDDLRQRLG